MAKFKVVSSYLDKGIELPQRATRKSAGYDLASAEDIVVPSTIGAINNYFSENRSFIATLELCEKLVKANKLKPVMIPTGLSIELSDDEFFQIQPRSSTGTKYLLMMASSLGIIDADYIDSDNEGHMYLAFVNLSPFDIQIQKGDKLAQGIIQKYITVEDDTTTLSRNGGFGSTGQ